MITKGLGRNSNSFFITRGLGKVSQEFPSTPSNTYVILEDKQILFNKLLSSYVRNTDYIQSDIYNQDFIGKSLIIDRSINCNTITCSFINKGTTDENLENLTIDEIVYAIVEGSMQIVYQDGNVVFIRLVKNINKSVKGTTSKNKQIGSNVSTGKMIE